MDVDAQPSAPVSGLPTVELSLDAVIMAVTQEVPRILTVRRPLPVPELRAAAGEVTRPDDGWIDALPFGPLDPVGDRTLERGLRRWVREQTGLALGYVEQLYTFGDRERDPRELHDGSRVVSVVYLALVREGSSVAAPSAQWRDGYRFLPWEDWRAGRPPMLDRTIAPALYQWADAAPDAGQRALRQERTEIAFGLGSAGWDGERVLERFELLFEVGLVAEARHDRRTRAIDEAAPNHDAQTHTGRSAGDDAIFGRPMVLDHRRIVATALGRLRGKIKYKPVVFELLPPTFTLLQLQRVVEALAGMRLHKGNLRRLVESAGLVEGTGEYELRTGGRPAELFQFRREVLRERRALGVGLPSVRQSGSG